MAKAVTLKNTSDEDVYPVTDISLVNGAIYADTLSALEPTTGYVSTAMLQNNAVTDSKIDWSNIVSSTNNKIILGDIMIQWGKQDFPSQSFNNDWFQGHGRGDADNTFDYPTPFSQAVDTLIMIPITAPIQNVQISGTGSGTTSPNLTPVTAKQLNQSMTWSAYWIAIGKK